ncbi:uncharacterized protein F13E6.1 isoform X3 [Diabrotica virgifera virgifera]|uniref:Tumor protein D54 n=1 Tax=Diabrotica virgifera virgifera TaxID=50390 RepID=A0ABM5K1W1_DIAVI|nr:uncharacterized protein F13E6.1 isoform X3 [Diabrotica virgifera virgifera]
MQNIEDTSLEYIEDPYFNPQVSSATPSLDEPDLDEYDLLENELDLFDLRQLDFDEVVHNSLYSYPDESESVNVEAEFFNVKRANLIIRTFFKNKLKKQVRVTYCDLTKPYLAKLPKDSNFRRYLDITTNEEAMAAAETPIPDLSHLSTEERAEQERLWKEELATIEDEISTLRTVLASKMRRSAELKRNLGITVWKEVTDDINQGIKNVKESNVYQKTSSLLGGITGNITNKIGQMRHSESFKSFEEKVGSAYENVKGNVVTFYETKVASRSGSQHSLDEAGRSRSGSTVTSPTIPEDKPLA